MTMHVNKVRTKISKSVGVMRKLYYQLPADEMLFFGVFPSGVGKIGKYSRFRTRIL